MRLIWRLVQHGDYTAFLKRARSLGKESTLVLASQPRSKASRAPSSLRVATKAMLLFKMAMKLAFARKAFAAACVPAALMHGGAVEVLSRRHLRWISRPFAVREAQ